MTCGGPKLELSRNISLNFFFALCPNLSIYLCIQRIHLCTYKETYLKLPFCPVLPNKFIHPLGNIYVAKNTPLFALPTRTTKTREIPREPHPPTTKHISKNSLFCSDLPCLHLRKRRTKTREREREREIHERLSNIWHSAYGNKDKTTREKAIRLGVGIGTIKDNTSIKQRQIRQDTLIWLRDRVQQ